MTNFEYEDETWSEEQWRRLLEQMIDDGFATWKDVTALTLGHMNPSQVGTSLASSDGFKRRYGKGNTMRVVMEWFYGQDGRCVDCDTRLELQADHSTPRESFEDPLDADFIENMVLRCRRCNVIKRPSHKFGGNTHLTAESALMWLLFTFRPRTRRDFTRMCRLYGMTMADIRMHEGWAMAHWLQHADGVQYVIDDQSKPSRILLWDDGALTRSWVSDQVTGARVLYENVSPGSDVCYVASASDGNGQRTATFYRTSVSDIPFSHYFAGSEQAPQALAINYSPPKRKGEAGDGPTIAGLPPRGMQLHAHQVVEAGAEVLVGYGRKAKAMGTSSRRKIGDFAPTLLSGLRFEIELAS
jgi:hypothetical protein